MTPCQRLSCEAPWRKEGRKAGRKVHRQTRGRAGRRTSVTEPSTTGKRCSRRSQQNRGGGVCLLQHLSGTSPLLPLPPSLPTPDWPGQSNGNGGCGFFLACAFFIYIFKGRSSRAHKFHPLGQDQSTVAQRAETTVSECSLTSCAWARFPIGAQTMPGQRHSQPTPTSLWTSTFTTPLKCMSHEVIRTAFCAQDWIEKKSKNKQTNKNRALLSVFKKRFETRQNKERKKERKIKQDEC